MWRPIYTHSNHYWSLSAEMLMAGLWGHSLLSPGGTTSPGHTEPWRNSRNRVAHPLAQVGNSLLLVNDNHLRNFVLCGLAAPSCKNLGEILGCFTPQPQKSSVCLTKILKDKLHQTPQFQNNETPKGYKKVSFIVPHIEISEQALKFSKFSFFVFSCFKKKKNANLNSTEQSKHTSTGRRPSSAKAGLPVRMLHTVKLSSLLAELH